MKDSKDTKEREFDMSEIAKGKKSSALAKKNQAISEHAQKPEVFDKTQIAQ